MFIRTASIVTSVVLTLASCGDDDPPSSGEQVTTSATSTTVAVPLTTTTPVPDSPPSTASTPSTASPPTTESTAPVTASPPTAPAVALQQPAIWPAADVVFERPEEAAADFVSEVLGVPPELGEFRPGDARSGEIEVYSLGEGASATPIVRSLLLVRQLGPHNGWFVLAAVNEHAAIDQPAAMSEVPAGPITVSGVGRGFEANVVVSAFLAGDVGVQFDRAVTMGGSFEEPAPISVELDLSTASPGDVVTLLIQGGTGLETDPGDFGAIPVVVAE